MLKSLQGLFACCIVIVSLASCETHPSFLTVTIYESPQRIVRLQAISNVNQGKGFSHPAEISTEQMKAVLSGLFVEIETTAIPLFHAKTPADRRRLFSDREVEFFAPLFVQGLSQATPEELVTFFETADISSMYRLTTSGGIFIKDDALHVIVSNYNVKTEIWQDNADYQAPFRLRPLEPIDPEPGRVVFEPQHLMIQDASVDLGDAINGKPWHTAVRLTEVTGNGREG